MGKYKILIVEDDEVTICLLQKHLKNEGYSVFIAKNGIEGVEQALKILPNLIIMDVMMPEKDGVSSVLNIRTNSRLRAVPIIMYSQVSEKEEETLTRQLGVADYISKGEIKKLLETIKNILKG